MVWANVSWCNDGYFKGNIYTWWAFQDFIGGIILTTYYWLFNTLGILEKCVCLGSKFLPFCEPAGLTVFEMLVKLQWRGILWIYRIQNLKTADPVWLNLFMMIGWCDISRLLEPRLSDILIPEKKGRLHLIFPKEEKMLSINTRPIDVETFHGLHMAQDSCCGLWIIWNRTLWKIASSRLHYVNKCIYKI